MAALGTIGASSPRPTPVIFNVFAAEGLPHQGHSFFPPFAFVTISDSERKSIRGFVKNAAGVGIARLVMAIDRATGALQDTAVSSAVDGSFELLPPTTAECVVVLIPDNADSKNAVALDRIVPVDQL